MAKKLSYTERMVFLETICNMVADDATLMPDIINSLMEGRERAYRQVNELRVNAETSLAFFFSLVPKASLDKNPGMAIKAKKTLIDSGMFAGTAMARQLEADVEIGEVELAEHEAESKKESKRQQIAHWQLLRARREQVRHKKRPVATINAGNAAKTLTQYPDTPIIPLEIRSGKDNWDLHAWVLTFNEEAPDIERQYSMLYVGGDHGRDTYASEELALAAVESIRQFANNLTIPTP